VGRSHPFCSNSLLSLTQQGLIVAGDLSAKN
jgi:hypothetical protein